MTRIMSEWWYSWMGYSSALVDFEISSQRLEPTVLSSINYGLIKLFRVLFTDWSIGMECLPQEIKAAKMR